ncbi:MAG TPA: CRISPR-associated endonuclease Cas1 [Chthonomonadales bacterium]|nr:CRISPR-associated endonuclease Cas1 [Chthonomonadales bacterium]
MILYVREQGAAIHRTGERLVIRKDGTVIQSVRLREVERVVLVGPIDMTTPAMYALLDAGIDTDLLTEGGRYRGRLAPGDGKNVLLRRTQHRRADDEGFRLGMARVILDAKIANCRYVLLRFLRNHASPAIEAAAGRLEKAQESLARQTSLESCLGVEGDAARAYFAALGQMTLGDFAFSERSRRPPRDPVNALLSFGYTLLATECAGALAAHGLDPYVGMVHSVQYGRPALALDLLEEFRPLIGDRVALGLVNKGVLKRGDFEAGEDGGVRMTGCARTRYLRHYHQVMTRETLSRTGAGSTSFRRILQRQAASLRSAIEGPAPYDPFTPR